MVTERRLADFTGLWRVHREITHADGTRGLFAGTARFDPVDEGLAYVEEGQLRMGAAPPLTATQRYRWDADLNVFFEDGRFFHQVPHAGGPSAHWCAPDQYNGRYDFHRWPEFTVRWQVRGPRKDYVLLSRYTRSGSD